MGQRNIDYFLSLSADVAVALKEDIGQGDLTAALVPAGLATATVTAKEAAVVCGRPWFDQVFAQLDPSVRIDWACEEGDCVSAGTVICRLQGEAASLLTGERTALNFLQTLSGTASVTRRYVEALNSDHTRLLDTRKTLPGLRLAQKYAVKTGGGQNHRVGLYDAILIKENHIMASGGIAQAVKQARQQHPEVMVEVETETMAELAEAYESGADTIMLDNFSLAQIKEAVSWVQSQTSRPTPPKLEASGNVTLSQCPKLGQTGVDFVSTGAITKHLQAIDYSMRFELPDTHTR
ncbi:MAG: carboxylating nicotinate-nucleotide diphosphorylase [Hydrogenovibrio sp.]|uniref:carboxylating nicotinate-nucleotide diphosphorylase n=1 Tax=Hydrogenovibrio sp. TaxID=2065821 RepID=UPI0028700EAA|nr:carboxylating nicotinate-nucleotide diphosphorylase [Hydrogenovibrio sp.]MDR9497807.1 carboxylating nicotinate-nucleotide diphosphorylase [Hydrogenovibrio sp.]